jgi:hydrogenase maturation protease
VRGLLAILIAAEILSTVCVKKTVSGFFRSFSHHFGPVQLAFRKYNGPMDRPLLPTLVLGIGNILLRDEGVGVRVVEALRLMSVPAGVELVDGGTGGADLVEVLADRRHVIVVDAMAADDPPGTIRRMTPDDLLPQQDVPLSLHQLGLLESLAIARRLGCAPGEVIVFGIQPAEIAPGLDLTPTVAAVVPKVAALVLQECSQHTPCADPM